ncbi:MAG TPA: cation diffusion facilitator family transporter, partial [Acidimicrobiales bacterium]|nr:cation diffusion facilitator family transporter [Acidimicrobiales bacterium]
RGQRIEHRSAKRPAAMTRSTRLWSALAVNLVLVAGELAAGLAARASALVADAGHNLTDVAGLLAALLAVRWAARPRSDVRSFGNHRATILAALFNSVALALITASIVGLSIVRIVHPEVVNGVWLAGIGGAALVLNTGSALVLREPGADLNLRVAMTHMAADGLAAALALVAGVIIVVAGHGADLADPAAALGVSLVIVVQAVKLVRTSVDVLLESTPADVDLMALRGAITDVEGVADVHDIHVWSLSSDVRALSAHLVLDGHPTLEEAQARGELVREAVVDRFGLAHTTLELECERCTDLEDPCDMDGLQRPVIARGSIG